MSATSTRRALLGASAAATLLAGSARTGAAELPAPSSDGADAELLAACRRFIDLQTEYGRLLKLADADPTPDGPDPDAIDAAERAVSIEQEQLGHWIAGTRAQTQEGLRAKARAALAAVDVRPGEPMRDRLQHAALQNLAGERAPGGVLAVAFPVPPPESPDADLIRLAREYVLQDAELHRALDAGYEWLPSDPRAEVLYASCLPRVGRLHETREELTALRATTPEGVYAKARAVLHRLCADANSDPHCLMDQETALAHSLVLDLLAIPRPA